MSNKARVRHTYEIGHDDYALTRVPMSARYSWVSVAIQRFGQISCLPQFLLGATVGFGMDFYMAFWALTLGAIILEFTSIIIGIIGQREGLSTSVLARLCGFGTYGSSLIGLIIAICLIGWFGVQNEVFAEGLHSLIGGLPTWGWATVTGILVTLIVIYGFSSMALTAYITVPIFLLLIIYSLITILSHYSFVNLLHAPTHGSMLSLATGTTIVAGGFIVGAIATPDMSRFNRSKSDVIKQTIVGIMLGEYVIGLSGVLLAHAIKSSDVITIISSTSGVIGTIVLITATLKINDWNLYSSSLGFVNFFDTVFKFNINRGIVTLVIGILGTILSAIGVLKHFVGFLIIIGVMIPPIAGIMIVDYFVLRRHRKKLDESLKHNKLPVVEKWNPMSIAAWIFGSLIGYWLQNGIASINSLIFSALFYYLGMSALKKLKLIQE